MAEIKIDPVPQNLEPVKQITSEQWSVNWRDVGKGALVAVITAVLTVVLEAIQEGGLNAINWPTVGTVAISTLAAYLLKQFTDPTKTVRTYKKVDAA